MKLWNEFKDKELSQVNETARNWIRSSLLSHKTNKKKSSSLRIAWPIKLHVPEYTTKKTQLQQEITFM